MGELGLCTIHDITSLVHTQVWADITTDTGWPMLITRILHNKWVYTLFFFFRCYGLYVDLQEFVQFASPLLLPYIAAAVYIRRTRKIVLIPLLIAPIVFMINPFYMKVGTRIELYQYAASLFAIIGCLAIITHLLQKK